MSTNTKPVRCAIYTRKSTEEGLDQEFNSLDAQRASAEAFIQSQGQAGWICLPERYDDGGYTGGNMDRPALQRLLADIAARKLDLVICYKVDRLSRSLLDFARMMETFDQHGIAFAAVTQQFNTASSMGRLVLNVLLSFAQFEREMIAERTRDKMAAARRKGMWVGGQPVLGYDVDPSTRKLRINEPEAARVRAIFRLYLKHAGLIPVVQELARRGWATKRWTTRKGQSRGGGPISKTRLYHLLTNVVYIGKVRYRDEVHEGEQPAILAMDIWQRVQDLLRRQGSARPGYRSGALLGGLLRCAACDRSMCPAFASKDGRRYHYYTCSHAQKRGWKACPSPSLPATAIERLVVEQLQEQGVLKSGWEPASRVEQAAWLQELIESVQYDSRESTLTIALRAGLGQGPRVLTCPIHVERTRHGRKVLRAGVSAPPPAAPLGRLPRVTRWMALALRCADLLRDGSIRDQAELARLGHVSRARASQILNLLHLAPDIQQALLFLPGIERGRDPVLLCQLQPLARMLDWTRQRQCWRRLVGGRQPRL
jgi:DNA invertase Pin-like site-specific DNA recombinase